MLLNSNLPGFLAWLVRFNRQSIYTILFHEYVVKTLIVTDDETPDIPLHFFSKHFPLFGRKPQLPLSQNFKFKILQLKNKSKIDLPSDVHHLRNNLARN